MHRRLKKYKRRPKKIKRPISQQQYSIEVPLSVTNVIGGHRSLGGGVLHPFTAEK
jgi:hypothetical protein